MQHFFSHSPSLVTKCWDELFKNMLQQMEKYNNLELQFTKRKTKVDLKYTGLKKKEKILINLPEV